jgi:hypothetical protein
MDSEQRGSQRDNGNLLWPGVDPPFAGEENAGYASLMLAVLFLMLMFV